MAQVTSEAGMVLGESLLHDGLGVLLVNEVQEVDEGEGAHGDVADGEGFHTTYEILSPRLRHPVEEAVAAEQSPLQVHPVLHLGPPASLLFVELLVFHRKTTSHRVGGLGRGVEEGDRVDPPLTILQLRVEAESRAVLLLVPSAQRGIGGTAVAEVLDHVVRPSFFLVREGSAYKENQLVGLDGMQSQCINGSWVVHDLAVPSNHTVSRSLPLS